MQSKFVYATNIILFSFFVLEYNEKLKAKVTEILEEKTQVEEKKQIITGLCIIST